jgi:protease II
MACVQVGGVETSPSQQLLAWTEDTVGGEKYTLRVKVHPAMSEHPAMCDVC